MRRVRTIRKKKKGGKKVNYELVKRETQQGEGMYRLVDHYVEQYHEDLSDARIGLAWCTSWRPDVDGRLILGQCRKQSDLHREFMEFDFIILLSKDWWGDPNTTAEQREALIDHELCHAAPALDDRTGEQKVDERGRKVWRMRKHDIEEFSAVVHRHGIYKSDIARFYRSLLVQVQKEGFQPCEACKESPGFVATTIDRDGVLVPAVVRCECFKTFAQRQDAAQRMAS
jgi:hypothetical protein